MPAERGAIRRVREILRLKHEFGATTWSNRQVADLIDHQQRTAAHEADFLAQRTLAFSLGEDSDEIGKRDEVDALARPNGLDRECCGEMGLPVPGSPSRWMASALLMK